MLRIWEAMEQKKSELTKSQRLLASFLTQHGEQAAFLSSFELAAVSGVSQTTVMRFATTLGFRGFADMQEALRYELRQKLSAIDPLSLIREDASDWELVKGIVTADLRNLRRMMDITTERLPEIARQALSCQRLFLYGTGSGIAAVSYLSWALRPLLPCVINLNLTGDMPLSAASDICVRDYLFCVAGPGLANCMEDLLAFAKQQKASSAVICGGAGERVAGLAGQCIAVEWGDLGVGGTLAPVISLCGALVCLLARRSPDAHARVRESAEALRFFKQVNLGDKGEL